MTYDPKRHHRRSIRLKGYDYSQAGAYFVTIVCQDRTCLFGKVVDGVMHLNDAGRMVQTVWDEITEYYPGVDVDASVIMPNHMHGIVVLYDPVGAGPRTRPDDHDHPPLGQTRAGPRTHPDDPDPPPLGQTRDNHGATTGQPQGATTGQPQGATTGQPQGAAPTTPDRQQSGRMSLPDVVHRFKTLTTKRYTDGVKQMGWKPYNRRVWQRNYYEHIVRNEGSLQRIRDYIVGNPALWDEDRENPDVVNKKNER